MTTIKMFRGGQAVAEVTLEGDETCVVEVDGVDVFGVDRQSGFGTWNAAGEWQPVRAGARPMKGTPEWDLWVTAISIARRAPRRHSETTVSANIPWTLINQLRTALTACGVEWDK
jgi:hypothetical protein